MAEKHRAFVFGRFVFALTMFLKKNLLLLARLLAKIVGFVAEQVKLQPARKKKKLIFQCQTAQYATEFDNVRQVGCLAQ